MWVIRPQNATHHCPVSVMLLHVPRGPEELEVKGPRRVGIVIERGTDDQPGGLDMVEFVFDPSGSGRPVKIELRFPEGITAAEIRRLPWSRWIREADRGLRISANLPPDTEFDLWEGRDLSHSYIPAFPSAGKSRPGRRGYPAAFYEQIAVEYRELLQAGSTRPTHDIAKAHNVSRHTAAGWVRGCRDRGLLPPARPGKAG